MSSDHNADGHSSTEKQATKAVNSERLHLLLHCVDGCVPYLSPSQLEKYFPPDPSSLLWIGLAAQDTCVCPVLHNTSSSTEEVDSNHQGAKKVKGYTFSDTKLDPWLLPYTRLTVPSFFSKNSYGLRRGKSSPDSSKEGYSNAKNSNTNKAIFVWTPHGRQKLAVDAYAKAALEGLQSQYTLSLCDYVSPREESLFDDNTRTRGQKRNEEWYQKLVEAGMKYEEKCQLEGNKISGRIPRASQLWIPVLLPGADRNHREEIRSEKQFINKLYDDVRGVAFVGQWRPGILTSHFNGHVHDSKNLEWKAILSADSLSDILGIAVEGYANIIGTNLPSVWAKNKLAFGVAFVDSSSGASERYMRRQRISDTGEMTGALTERDIPLNYDGCMDLSDKRYARDPMPLVGSCSCLCCNQDRCFSRAYIHHLVCAKELLAEILLFGHNLHHLLKLFHLFNDIKNRKHLKEFIESQTKVVHLDLHSKV